MVRAGWSPSVRLFEAAACGVPIISDQWPGLEEFFVPGREIFVSRSAAETLALVKTLPEEARLAAAERARRRVASTHTAAHRAAELEVPVVHSRPAARPVLNLGPRRTARVALWSRDSLWSRDPRWSRDSVEPEPWSRDSP